MSNRISQPQIEHDKYKCDGLKRGRKEKTLSFALIQLGYTQSTSSSRDEFCFGNLSFMGLFMCFLSFIGFYVFSF